MTSSRTLRPKNSADLLPRDGIVSFIADPETAGALLGSNTAKASFAWSLLSQDRLLLRAAFLSAVHLEQITLREAAQCMDVSYRQSKRLWKRFRKFGMAGLVDERRRPSNRAISSTIRDSVITAAQDRGQNAVGVLTSPTALARRLRAELGIDVDPETIRRWLIAAGLWIPCKRVQDARAAAMESASVHARPCGPVLPEIGAENILKLWLELCCIPQLLARLDDAKRNSAGCNTCTQPQSQLARLPAKASMLVIQTPGRTRNQRP